jgi:hypothetical protein
MSAVQIIATVYDMELNEESIIFQVNENKKII